MGVAGVALFWIGVLAILAGAVAWVVAHQRSHASELAAMSDDQRAWYQAEAAYRGAIKASEKGQRTTASSESANLKAAERALAAAKKVGSRPLGAVGSVKLAEDHASVGGVTFVFAKGPLNTRVDVVLPSKSGKKGDPGSATLWVSGAQGSTSATLAYGQLKALQALAPKIESASRAWPALSEKAAEDVKKASAAVASAQEHQRVALESAAAGIEATKADRAAVEAARAKVQTAFCPACSRNVALTDGACPEGHGTLLEEYRPADLKPVRAASRPKRGVRLAQVAVAAGVVLFIVGAALAPQAAHQPAVAEKPSSVAPDGTPATPSQVASPNSGAVSPASTDASPAPAAPTEPAQPDPAASAAAEKQKKQQIYLAFEASVYAAEKPANTAIKSFQNSAKRAAKGKASVLDVYSATADAKDACDGVMMAYSRLETPQDLPQEVRDMLDKARDDLSTAYYLKREAFGSMEQFLDSQQPSKAQDYKDKMGEADTSTLAGVAELMQAREALGLPLTSK